VADTLEPGRWVRLHRVELAAAVRAPGIPADTYLAHALTDLDVWSLADADIRFLADGTRLADEDVRVRLEQSRLAGARSAR
jgi:hypothetical protein